ncbi:MAG TPA: N-acetyl-gamma-glutamyl-phosphate reductase [Deltaproteobacteria bacterium]|nr:N-acetyl-gamma-glutamyl-phosphate reductase [Deltaproteobacteria bacterium]
MIKAAVIGASGYTGLELLRILALHDKVEVCYASSRQFAGAPVSSVFPSLMGYLDGLFFDELKGEAEGGVLGSLEGPLGEADCIFCALPHGASMAVVPGLIEAGRKVVDLSADFRLRDAGTYRAWYAPHRAPELLGSAVYGLPELYRRAVEGARLIANPGCYPTSAVLALAPAVKEEVVDPSTIVIDSKSGVSGAGRSASLATSFCEVNEAFGAYKVAVHRHTPEIEAVLSDVAGAAVRVSFTPHLLPLSRGILTTVTASLTGTHTTVALLELYRDFYDGEPFVRVRPEGVFPNISWVRGSNFCDIGLRADGRTGRVVIVSAIDNLVKGASGAAVQNMNILFGFDETEGLRTAPLQI